MKYLCDELLDINIKPKMTLVEDYELLWNELKLIIGGFYIACIANTNNYIFGWNIHCSINDDKK